MVLVTLKLPVLLSDYLTHLVLLGLGRKISRLLPQWTPFKVVSSAVLCPVAGGFSCVAERWCGESVP